MSIDLNKLKNDPHAYANSLTIPKLAQLLNTLTQAYYTEKPIVSDDIYDMIREILEKKDPQNKFLQTVGYDVTNNKSKVELPYPAYSQDKNKDIPTFKKKYKGPYVYSDKLDGMSLTLHKANSKIKLYTRGNGILGQDVSHLIKYLFKDFDFEKLPKVFGIRGELVISRVNFEKVKHKYLDHRSCLAGLMNSKPEALITEPDKAELILLSDFLAHELIEPRHKQNTQFEMLKGWGFKYAYYEVHDDITEDGLTAYLTKRRNESEYYIDGIVIGDCSAVYELPTDGNPKYAFAFKRLFGDGIAESVVEDVEWNVSKNGLIKPIVIIKPTKINGITIKKITGNNARFVVQEHISIGSKVKFVRSGDVIPKIISIESNTAKPPKLPDIPYVWSESGADVVAINISKSVNKTMIIKKISFFFETIEAANIGPGVVKKMVDAGYDTVEKILTAKKKDLVNIDGLGEDNINKIYNNIDTAFSKCKLSTLMHASGLMGSAMGSKRIEIILNTIPDIMKAEANDKLIEQVKQIDGFSDITSKQFVKNLDKFREFFKILKTIANVDHLLTTKVEPITTNGKLKDMHVAMTGKRDNEIKTFIIDNGGTIDDKVKKTTTLLLSDTLDDMTSNKFVDANKFKVEIMLYDDFRKKYMNTKN